MTALSAFPSVHPKSNSSRDFGSTGVDEISFAKNIPHTRDACRKWFADLMWATFPGHSIREKAERAAPVLGLSTRQCENLLKMESETKLTQIIALLAIAGTEHVFDFIEGSGRASRR